MRIAIEVASAAIGTICFCILFCIPKKYFIVCGGIGAAGWLIYRLLLLADLSDFLACLVATIVITLLSRFSAVRTKTPSTIYLLPGILPLIPGGGIYRTVFYLINNDVHSAVNAGLNSISIVGGIVLAIVLVFEIPQRFFRTRR